MVRIALIFYAALAAAAAGINAVRGAPLVPLAGGPALIPATSLALVLAVLTVAFSRYASDRYTWARELEVVFRRLLGPLSVGEVLALALLSGFCEELFFRGMLQPAFARMLGSDLLGLGLATLAFAALHVLPGQGPRHLAWTVFAFVLGGVLGALYWWSRSIVPPFALHFVVNALNLRRITRP